MKHFYQLWLCNIRFGAPFLALVFILACSIARAQSFVPRPPSLQPEERHAISVTSELVVLPVRVTDAGGNFVSGLSENDFRVYDERRLRDLSLFQKEDAPVSVGLVIDHSGSMELKLPNVITAVSEFAHSGNSGDEMFVVDFNDNVVTEPLDGKPFTNSSVELEKAVEAVSAHGRTALYDAVAEGINHLQLSHLQRKALIVISDGGDNASQSKRSEILELARQSQIVIYSIVLEDNVAKEQDPKALKQLSEETGGVAFLPQSRQSVVDSSRKIARDLREQYVLGFVPGKHASGSSFRKVEVKVITADRGKLHVRTRAGYSVGGDRTALADITDAAAIGSSKSSTGAPSAR